MRKLLHTSFIVLLLAAVNTLPAQVRQYSFTHYTTGSGLISNEANCVIQDADGYIWSGSAGGLQRFDGTRFKTFRSIAGDPSTIPTNNIWQLMLDRKKNLWVLCAEGNVGIFNTKTLRFTEVPVKPKLQDAFNSGVKRLICDEYGNIFLLFGGVEVLTWNEEKNEFSYKNNFFTLPDGKYPADFVQQPGTHKYWISIQGAGVVIYNKTTGHFNSPGNNPDHDPVVDKLSDVNLAYNFYFDKRGRCWFQSWGPGFPEVYMFELSAKAGSISRFDFRAHIQSYYETQPFFEQQDSTIWVTGLNVFAKFLEKEKKFQFVYNGYVNERSIAFERVNRLSEDRERNLWVATSNNGLYRFNPSGQYFINIPHFHRVTQKKGHGTVMSIVNLRDGGFYAGTWGEGFYHYDKDLNLVPINIRGIDEKGSPTVWNFYASGDSTTIWIASQPGLFAIDQDRRSSSYYNPPVLQNKTIRQVAEDKNGNLWLGIQNYGVFKWDAADKKAGRMQEIKRFEKIPVTQINKLMADRYGYLWVGTPTKGLFLVDPAAQDTIKHFTTDGPGKIKLPENAISCVLDYDDSTVVITTTKHVIFYNRFLEKMKVIGKPGFLPGDISSVEKDRKGYLWVSTTDGIYRVSPTSHVFVRFNREDGIDNDRFSLTSSARLRDGRLAFGSSEEFIVFDPLAIDLSSVPASAVITDFKVMNTPLPVDSLMNLSQAVLGYDDNSLQIEFSPLTYNKAVMIAYKMDGLDKEWRIADNTNMAIYSYLPPGKYTFLLKTIDAEKNTTTPVTSLSIRVNEPFWKAWWFYSLLVLLGGLLLFWFDRERMKRKETLQKMRSTIADNLHNEVNTALNNINILSEMARLKADKDPQKSKEYIEQIHTRSHNMIIAMDDMLWSLDPLNDGMTKTTERMREYIEALRNRYGVNIDIAVDKKVESLQLNMKLRHDAFLLFKEGIKNLVTLGAANCHVYIRSDNRGDLLFTTLFDSDKCDMQQLHNMLNRQDLENRLNMINASIELDLHKNHSAISLRVPVK